MNFFSELPPELYSNLSIAIAFFSLYLAYRSLKVGKDSINELNIVKKGIDSELNKIKETNRNTHDLISRITKLFDVSEREGLEMVYKDRMEALMQFKRYIEDETEEVVIVGSSLLGLFLYITGFEEIVKHKPEKFKFILTHPDSSSLREGAEGRDPGVIKNEIIEGIHKLSEWGVQLTSIKLYKGAPSVFMIIASNHVLLNPYPYGTEAYRCFCLQFSARGSIYHQYHEKHYQKIWDSEWVEDCTTILNNYL